jgi:hypothetical protein
MTIQFLERESTLQIGNPLGTGAALSKRDSGVKSLSDDLLFTRYDALPASTRPDIRGNGSGRRCSHRAKVSIRSRSV